MHNMIINPIHTLFSVQSNPGSHAINPEVQVAMICASHLINLKTDHCHALPIETLHNIVLGQIHSGAMLVESHGCWWMYIIFLIWIHVDRMAGWWVPQCPWKWTLASHCMSLQLLRSNTHGCINSSKDLEYQRVARTSRRLGNTCTSSFRKLIWSGSVYKPLMISDPK